MLAVVASPRLLGQSVATHLENGTRPDLALLKAHEDAVTTAEPLDKCLAHGGTAVISIAECAQSLLTVCLAHVQCHGRHQVGSIDSVELLYEGI